ncbi:MAG: hypothetical protein KJN96_10180 [Eudoraea sp.]|nr:hypothetical protein [Eudoraea sp.]
MKHSKLWFMISLIVFIGTGFLLLTGSSVLTISLSRSTNIPLGTFTTWAGIASLPLALYFGIRKLREPTSKKDRFLAYILKILIGLAILWMPICYLLAGNISFSFTEKAEFQGGQLAMQIFWYFSYFVAAGPIILFLIYGITSFFKKKK